MKSKKAKIQTILTKGIATFIVAILMMSSLSIINVFAADIEESIVSSGTSNDDPTAGTDYIGSEDAEYVTGTIIKEIDKLKNQLTELNVKLNSNFTYESFITKIAANSTIEISSELELRALSIYVAEGNNCSGKIFRLTNNIVLTDTLEWSPIGNSTNQFRGTIDGGGYTISGMLISIKQSYAGLVGYLGSGGSIKNLTISNSNISIPPEVDNKILNDLLDSETVNYSYLGAIAGYAVDATITNCKNTTNISGGNIVGGIVGRMKNGSITYCSNSGYIQAYRTAGGIVGSFDVIENNSNKNYKVFRCKNEGSVYSIVANAGGIAGTLRNNAIISYCLNNGEISTATATFKVYVKAEESKTITPQNAGGIAGVFLADVIENKVNTTKENISRGTIEYCLNDSDAKINGYMDIGGIAGQLGRGDIPDEIDGNGIIAGITNCINNSNFSIDDYKNKKNVGQLAGRAGVKSHMAGYFNYCSYLGYEVKDSIGSHKTTENKILAFGFDGNIYINVDKTGGKYVESKTFKKTTDEDISKIKDTTGPQFNENVKVTIVNYGSSQDFAVKGDIIRISIPFDEPININRIYPKLSLINANIEADYIGMYEKSLVFEYTVTGKEDPLATAPYAIDNLQLTGTMYDIFGNKTSYSSQKLSIGNPGVDLKIVNSNLESIKNASVTYSKDKVLYTITGFSNIIDGKLYFNKNSTMKVSATLAGKLTHSGDISENLDSDIPKLQIKTDSNSNLFKDIEGTYNTRNYTLTYDVGLSESASVSIEGLYLTTQDEIYIDEESAGVLNEGNTLVNVKNIIIDTVAPVLTVSTSVNNATESARYTVGEDVLIKLTTSEAIDLERSILPEINVSFSESGLGKYNAQGENARTGNAKFMEYIENEDGTITLKYRYTIQEGDEGEIQLSFADSTGTIQDIAGNTTDIKEQYTETQVSLTGKDSNWNSNLGVTVELYKNSVSSYNKITNKTYFSGADDLYALVRFDKKLYSYKDNINGKIYEKLIDKSTAPSLYIPKVNGEIKAECTGVSYLTNETAAYYKIVDIANNYEALTNIKNLKLVNENNKQSVDINGNTVSVDNAQSIKLTIEDTSEGLKAGAIKVVDVENIIIDSMKINEKMQFDIYADTSAPTVEINVIQELGDKYDVNGDGEVGIIDATAINMELSSNAQIINKENLTYMISFNEEVQGFTAEDITVNNGVKGEFKEVTKGKVYTLEIKPLTTDGNEGVLQVIVEADTCKDLIGYGNIRQESNITIDKVKPTFTSYTIKEESGKIIIEATFSEALSDASELIPSLTIGGNDYRGTWSDVEIYDNNKVKYVYSKDGSDGGKVEVSLNGTVKDIARNNSEKLNILVENDITLEQTIIKNGSDVYSFKKGNKAITDFGTPTYFVKGNMLTVIKVSQVEDENGEIKEVITMYSYTVQEEIDLTHMKYMTLTEPDTENGETVGTVKFSSTKTTGSINISEVNIYFDTIAPTVTTEIVANNPSTSEIYKEGDEFTIKATTSEVVREGYVSPEIKVNFAQKTGNFNEGKAQYVETITNENGTTTWVYRYVVSEGDEGEVSLSYTNGKVVDLAGNYTTLTTLNSKDNIFTTNNITVDASAPVVEIAGNGVTNNITNSNTIKYTFTWSEEVIGFTADDIIINNGTKGTLSAVTKNENGTYSYTMDVITNVETGNIGDIQVIIEQNACQDKVGLSNVRTENVIRVDKKAPILLGLEAYATENIKVGTDVDNVKEYYKVGEKVTIVATFDESISKSTAPTLNLQFSESGNAKGSVSTGTIDGNKITYTYNITNKDNGILSVKGFTGTVVDAAGNETTVTKRELTGDTIIADTTAPKLVEITAIAPNFRYDNLLSNEGETKRYGIGETITFITEYSEDVYNLASNNIENISETTAPVLKLKFGNTTRNAVFNKVEGNKIYYTYSIVSGDNGNLSISSISKTISDIAGNTLNTSNVTLPTLLKYEESITEENKVDIITADTTNSTITFDTSAVNYDDNGNEIKENGSYYRKGSVITITATTNEYVYLKDSNNTLSNMNKENVPTLDVSFSTSGTAKGQVECTNVEYVGNKTIFTYTYTIQANDNGKLNLNVDAAQSYDIALNENNAKSEEITTIVADTVNPVTNWQSWVESEAYGIVDNQNGTWTVTFSEQIYSYNPDTHTVGGNVSTSSAPILLVSKDNETPLETTVSNVTTKKGKTVITYRYADYTKNLGAFGMKFANVSDKAGNIFNFKDITAPRLQKLMVINPETGTYKADTEITIVATFSEKLAGTAPVLKLKFGEESAKGKVSNGIIENNTITYTYTITDGDNGILAIESYTGTGLIDLSDNEWVIPESVTLSGNQITADTVAPIVTITSDIEKTNKDVVTYTFTWSEPVYGFTIEDVEVTNGSKGIFTGKDGDKIYKLTVDTTNEGRQIVKVNAEVCEDIAGNLNSARATYNKVVIDYTKPTVRAKINGGNFVIDTDSQKSTLKETIVVNEELSKFEYAWSTETDIVNVSNWNTEDVSNITINSDINLSMETETEGTYYLYMKVTDLAGNELRARTKEFKVNNSAITFEGITETPTNEDVTVTVTYEEGLTENRKAGISGKTQSADSTKIILSENGTVYAEATDKVGNKVYAKQEVNNIDKIAPTAEIDYTENEDGSVTATITLSDGKVTNNDGKTTYTFIKNGEFTFEFEDELGNKAEATAKVTSIEEKEPSNPTYPEEDDTTAPVITLNYTTTSAKVGTVIGATITTNEDAIISYSWDNQNWTSTEGFARSAKAMKTPKTAGTYILYAKATDKSSNTSTVQMTFTVVASEDDIVNPEIIFEDLTTIQVNGVKYVKVSPTYTTNDITAKMDKDALIGKTPEYKNLTSDKKLKTGSEITINGETKYVIIVNGDVNCDGKVTFIGDVIMANNSRIGQVSLSTIQQLAADINNNGEIDFIPDIVAINNYRLGMIKAL